MIRRSLAFARLAVDLHPGAAPGQGPGHQNMVDTQPLILLKGELPIVPPAVQFARVVVETEGIDQSPVAQPAEGVPDAGLAQHSFGPGGRLAHVTILGRDIQIATQDQRLVGIAVALQMALEPVEPGQLVGVLVAADNLTVWYVNADDPQIGEPGR